MKYEILETIKDDRGFAWDPKSQITEMQISEETAKKLVSENKIKIIEGEFSKVKIK